MKLPVKCLHCQKIVGKQGLYMHLRSHGVRKPELGTDYAESISGADMPTSENWKCENWKCLKCGEIFMTKKAVMVHIVRGHKAKAKGKEGKLFVRTLEPATMLPQKKWPKKKSMNKERKSEARTVINHETRVIEIPVLLQVPVVVGKAVIKGEYNEQERFEQ